MTARTNIHEVIGDDELDRLIAQTLRNADVELAELRRQAHKGRFRSERLRRAWLAIEGLGRG